MFRKMPTEKEIIKQIEEGKLSFPPLSICLLQVQPVIKENRRADALVEVSWGDKKAKFVVEFKSISTPKAFQSALNQLKFLSPQQNFGLMLIMPFLNNKQLQELESEGISGIDLCGNGVVIVPGRFAIFRSGEKNCFTSSAPIKNIYRKNSSMVGRVFFVQAGYETVQEICAEINRRNTLVNRWGKNPMSLSTVSKALKTLEEDLIIERKDTIRLLQPDKLLEKLSDNYVPPNGERVRLKVPEGIGTIPQLLSKESQELGLPLVAAGTSSVGRYAVMQRGDLLSIYCPRLDKLLERLTGSQSDRFPNIELIEAEDETVYFDGRQEGVFWWASPVQVYLELMAGDKRDRETAEQVKSFLLKNLELG